MCGPGVDPPLWKNGITQAPLQPRDY